MDSQLSDKPTWDFSVIAPGPPQWPAKDMAPTKLSKGNGEQVLLLIANSYI